MLEEKIVEGSIDPERLVDKWIPNVTGTPFAVDRSYVEQVRDVTKSKVLDVLLQNMRCPCTTA